MAAAIWAMAGTSLSGWGTTQIPVWGIDGSLRGLFSLLFSGDWFLNGVKPGGNGSTEVPQRGQLPLMARRKRALARA